MFPSYKGKNPGHVARERQAHVVPLERELRLETCANDSPRVLATATPSATTVPLMFSTGGAVGVCFSDSLRTRFQTFDF